MRLKKTHALPVIFLLTVFLLLSSPSEALSFFGIFKEKHAAFPFKEKFTTFQENKNETRLYISCNKPCYKAGDTVWFQIYVINAADLTPSKKSQIVHINLTAPSGKVVKYFNTTAVNGSASGKINLEPFTQSGFFRLKAWTDEQKSNGKTYIFEKAIHIGPENHEGVTANLLFTEKKYRPGDEVNALLEVTDNKNRPLSYLDFKYLVYLDGRLYREYPGEIQNSRSAVLRFTLPENISFSKALLSIKTESEKQHELITKPVPLLPLKLNVSIRPEGGSLVNGHFSRVGVKVENEHGEPVDVLGRVETDTGKVVTEFHTVHDGLSFFHITPEAGRKYSVKIIKPDVVEKTIPLPQSLEKGFTMMTENKGGKHVAMVIRSSAEAELTVTVNGRDRNFIEKRISVKKGENRLTFNLESFPMGVVRFTLFDSKNIQRAERLCFINNQKKMKVIIETDKDVYSPREKVNMTIRTLDSSGLPVPARLTVSVYDMAEIKQKTQEYNCIFSSLFLEPDVTEKIWNPSFYFNEKEVNIGSLFDLQMMTQSWRGFSWQSVIDNAETKPVSDKVRTDLIKDLSRGKSISDSFPEIVYETTDTDKRVDFRSAIFFKGTVKTDIRGTLRLSFYTSDAITSFQAVAEGIVDKGEIAGRGEYVFKSRPHCQIDISAPVTVTAGDETGIPLTIVNTGEKPVTGDLAVEVPHGFKSLGPLTFNLTVKDGDTRIFHFPFIASLPSDNAVLNSSFTDGLDTEYDEKHISVISRGIPVSMAVAAKDADKSFEVNIENPVQGSLKACLTVFPTALSYLLKASESLEREFVSNFENALGSVFLNSLVFAQLKNMKNQDADLMKKTMDQIILGYNRLLSCETPTGGFSLSGTGHGNEILTAQALSCLCIMDKNTEGTGSAVLKRTADWLMARRDGKGGFVLKNRTADSLLPVEKIITNAFIVFALTEAEYGTKIKPELDKAVNQALKSDDAYQLALAANTLFEINDPRSVFILKNLLSKRKKDGSIDGKFMSVTRSTGRFLTVETTALAALAVLKSPSPDMKLCEQLISCITSERTASGQFGNINSTLTSLRTISSNPFFSPHNRETGRIEIFVNDKSAASSIYTTDQTDYMVFSDSVLSGFFEQGKSDVRVVFHDMAQPPPYTFSLSYNTFTVPLNKECPLKIQTTLRTHSVKIGTPGRMTVTVENTDRKKNLNMCVAAAGIPGGLSPLDWQLKDILDKGIADGLEVVNGYLVLYFTQLKQGDVKTINIDLKGEIPGNYEAPASFAHIYGNEENRHWIRGERVIVGYQ